MTLGIRLSGDPLRIFRGDANGVGQCFQESAAWGPQSSYVVSDTSRLGAVVGVQFRPRAATPLLSTPACELSDKHVSLEDLWG
jgi:hypothetical protein